MTREEQIAVAFADYSDARKLSTFGDFEYIDIQVAFEEGAEWADANPKSQWISVEDDLPCKHEEFIETGGHYLKETIYVITVNKYGIIENNYMILYDDGKWEWKYGATPCYWMLIPKLPKEIEIELATK